MERSSQTLGVAPTVYTSMMERVSTETVIVMSSVVEKACSSARVIKRVGSSVVAVHVACTKIEG